MILAKISFSALNLEIYTEGLKKPLFWSFLSESRCGGFPAGLRLPHLWRTPQCIKHVYQLVNAPSAQCTLESVQDLLIKLDMNASSGNKHFFTKSCHRQTYQNYEQPPQTYQNSYFQSHFSVLKIGRIFPKKKFYEEYWTRRPTFIKKCFWKFWFLRYFIF